MRYWYYILIALFFIGCESEPTKHSTEENFSITGQIKDGETKSLVFEALYATTVETIDTVKLDIEGNYRFTAIVNEAGFYRLKLADDNFVVLIAEPNDSIIIDASAQNLEQSYTISGSKETARLQQFNKFMNVIRVSADSLGRSIQKHQMNQDVNSYIEANNYKAVLLDKRDNYLRNFSSESPGSLASLAAVENLNPENNFQYYKAVANALKEKMPNSAYYQNLQARVEQWGRLAIGSEAPEITLNNPFGEPVSLSSLKGKVVLIDFWASWCKPCRMENPNVVKAYNKYKSKGFEVFSVSLDSNPQSWQAAIKQDNLTWTHVSDLKKWQSEVVKLYNINGIPLTYLLDKDGKIVAKNLRGQQLEQKLAELFED